MMKACLFTILVVHCLASQLLMAQTNQSLPASSAQPAGASGQVSRAAIVSNSVASHIVTASPSSVSGRPKVPTDSNPPAIAVTNSVPLSDLNLRQQQSTALAAQHAPSQIPAQTIPLVIQAKDILDSNDRAIARSAQMYEKFATLITIFISAVGFGVSALAALFAFAAFKSLDDFKKKSQDQLAQTEAELAKKLQKLEDLAAKEVRRALDQIRDAEVRAQESARVAQASATELQNRQEIVDNYLSLVDALQTDVAALRGVIEAAGLTIPPPTLKRTRPEALDPEQILEQAEADAIKALVEEKTKPKPAI